MHQRWLSVVFSSILAVVNSTNESHAQAQLRGIFNTGMGDIAAIRARAEAGDPKAQVALADSLLSNFRPIEALSWYRKAAHQGNVEGSFQTGRLLLHGAAGIPQDHTLTPSPSDGIPWLFVAATNGHGEARRLMGKAYLSGAGVQTNLIHAYAWLRLASESPSSIVARTEMNQLALKLDSASLSQATTLAEKMKKGDWGAGPVIAEPQLDPAIKLSGISSGKTPLAIISGKTVGIGERFSVKTKSGTVLKITCVDIKPRSVVIQIEGDPSPRTLNLR